MAGEPKVQVVGDGRVLMVSCGKAEFDAIKQTVCNVIGYSESVTEVVDLRVTDLSQWKAAEPFSRRRDRIALLGCAIVSFLLLFVFGFGIIKIIELFSLR